MGLENEYGLKVRRDVVKGRVIGIEVTMARGRLFISDTLLDSLIKCGNSQANNLHFINSDIARLVLHKAWSHVGVEE